MSSMRRNRQDNFYYLIYLFYGFLLGQILYNFIIGSVNLEYDGSYYLFESLKIKYYLLNGEYNLAFQNIFQTTAGKPFFPMYIFTVFLFLTDSLYTNVVIYNAFLLCIVILSVYLLKLDIRRSILAILLIFSNSYFLYYGHSLLFENLSASLFALLIVLSKNLISPFSNTRMILIGVLGGVLLLIKQNMIIYFIIVPMVSIYLSSHKLYFVKHWSLILIIAFAMSFSLYFSGFDSMYKLVMGLWSGGGSTGGDILYNRFVYLALFMLSTMSLFPLLLATYKHNQYKNNFYYNIFLFGFLALFFIDITADFTTRRLNIFIPVIVFWLVSSLDFKRDYRYILTSILLSSASVYVYSNYTVLEKYTHISAIPQPNVNFQPKDFLIDINIQNGDKVLFATITNTINPTTLLPFSLNKDGSHKFIISSPFFSKNEELIELVEKYNIVISSEKNPFSNSHPFFEKFEIINNYVKNKNNGFKKIHINNNTIHVMTRKL